MEQKRNEWRNENRYKRKERGAEFIFLLVELKVKQEKKKEREKKRILKNEPTDQTSTSYCNRAPIPQPSHQIKHQNLLSTIGGGFPRPIATRAMPRGLLFSDLVSGVDVPWGSLRGLFISCVFNYFVKRFRR